MLSSPFSGYTVSRAATASSDAMDGSSQRFSCSWVSIFGIRNGCLRRYGSSASWRSLRSLSARTTALFSPVCGMRPLVLEPGDGEIIPDPLKWYSNTAPFRSAVCAARRIRLRDDAPVMLPQHSPRPFLEKRLGPCVLEQILPGRNAEHLRASPSAESAPTA